MTLKNKFEFRKFSKMFKLAGPLVVVATILLTFQNCSDVAFAPNDYSDAPGTGFNVNPGSVYSHMTVGLTSVPPLKIVFVVDNSYTMIANQVNLSESFEKMFSPQNNTNLALFDTTAYLLNTAQLSLPYGATSTSPIVKLSDSQLSSEALQDIIEQTGFLPDSFLSLHRPSLPGLLSGKIPGDSIGYYVKKSSVKDQDGQLVSGKFDFSFEPMSVMNLLSNEDDSLYFAKGIYKPASQNAAVMVADFKERLSLLNNLRSAANYPEVSDQESGMCALARILNKPEDYFKPGDIPAFVIVSDENEANVAGDRCIASYKNFTGEEDLVKGRCEERTTKINGNYNVTTPAQCKLDYKNAYKVRYDYTVPTTQISYYKTAGYTAPKTNISYWVKSFRIKQSSVQYYLRVCEVRDGVVVESTCVNVKQQAQVVEGDFTSTTQACIDKAKSLNPKVLYGNAYLPSEQPTCTLTNPRVLPIGTTCNNLEDTNCYYDVVASQTLAVVYGSYSEDPEACKKRAILIPHAHIDNDHVPNCAVASAEDTPSGVCPTDGSKPGCVQKTPVLYTGLAPVVGDFFTEDSKCQTKAVSFSGAYVTPDYAAQCTAAPAVARSKTQNIPFTSGILTDPLLTLGADCTPQILTAFFNISENASLPQTGTCKIEPYTIQYKTVTKDTSTCEQIKSSFEAANVGKVAGVGFVEIPEGVTLLPFSKSEKQGGISCSTQCSSTSFCTPATNAVTNLTIEDYLKSIYGPTFTCVAPSQVVTYIGPFVDQLASLPDSELCKPSSAGVKRYAVREGSIYHKTGLGTAFVSGTVSGSGTTANQPEKSLPEYIKYRSAELFGTGNAMLTTFVRQVQDGDGQGGSVGTYYEALADDMEGQKFSVMAGDYSPALVELSEVIKSKIEHSFVVPDLTPPHKIYNVWIKTGDAAFVKIDPALWVQSGSTLTLNDIIEVKLGDKITVEFY